MDLTSPVTAVELSDAELENVSGGNAAVSASASLVGGLSTGLVEPLTAGACADLQAALSPQGAAAGAHTGVHTTSL
ncbi:class IIb bacteriocin, lactobin A/cerein 7B family [Streptomyces sp. AHA2]|uniref:class IIb bacteriocin, lactobin A/cerein 7B family n=1 Tax=Streptomyces sp. AHA2 TaxID=3064526 RepID=UPI002FE3F32F